VLHLLTLRPLEIAVRPEREPIGAGLYGRDKGLLVIPGPRHDRSLS